jgi:hypothetical protein
VEPPIPGRAAQASPPIASNGTHSANAAGPWGYALARRVLADPERKRFTLEILALGVAAEYLRHAQVWEELQSQQGNGTVLFSDPKDDPSVLAEMEFISRSAGFFFTSEWLPATWSGK